MGFSLTVKEGQDTGKRFVFDKPEISIGRVPENDLVLTDNGVSRRHLTISADGGRFVARDNGSANGTLVNGSRITESELKPGDEINVGPVVLSFSLFSGKVPPGKAIVKAPSTASIDPARRRTTSISPARPAVLAMDGPHSSRELAAMSASERARFLRERAASFTGRWQVFLLTKPMPVRLAVLAAPVLLLLLVLGLILLPLIRGGGGALALRDQSKERFSLTARPSQQVYGYGEAYGITAQTRDEAHFVFEYSDSLPVVCFLRFEAFGVDRKDELDISLNGAHVGMVAGGLGDYAKEQRLRLPKKLLKSGQPNEIVFDNAYNPPGKEPWALANVRLEIKPLPTGSPAELMKQARQAYELAEQRLSMRDVAFANRYDAWISLQRAQLSLEAIEPKPDLYTLVQQSLRDVDRELDLRCSKVMLAGKKQEELHDLEKALMEYKTGLQWFPGEDHPCRARLLQKLAEYGEPVP